jgi:hypothetical protein
LTVIVGYCGAGKSTLLRQLQAAKATLVTLDEGFANPGSERDREGRAAVCDALRKGADAAITSMDCSHKATYERVKAEVEKEAPGTTIHWIYFEDDLTTCNSNCDKDPERTPEQKDGNKKQNARWKRMTGYFVPPEATLRRVQAL